LVRSQIKLVVVIGATATGKSDLSLVLAQQLGGEIVCCDSVQVYQGFDIGSAKPTASQRLLAPHHLFDVKKWDEPFDAEDYAEAASAAIGEIFARGSVPILVGGTGLYLRALLRSGWHTLPSDQALRQHLNELSTEEAYLKLSAVDSGRAAQLHSHDRFRIMRALEVATLSGKTFAELTQAPAEPVFPCFMIECFAERATLHDRIAIRAAKMLKMGLVKEVADLLAAGVSSEAKPMRSIGYQQTCDFLAGRLPEAELASAITIATRQYAKRQMTWFRQLAFQARYSHGDQIDRLAAQVRDWLA
jgi:tRNA dimethylallyltransferase